MHLDSLWTSQCTVADLRLNFGFHRASCVRWKGVRKPTSLAPWDAQHSVHSFQQQSVATSIASKVQWLSIAHWWLVRDYPGLRRISPYKRLHQNYSDQTCPISHWTALLHRCTPWSWFSIDLYLVDLRCALTTTSIAASTLTSSCSIILSSVHRRHLGCSDSASSNYFQ